MTAKIEVDGRSVRLTHLDRVLWPAIGFTKAQMIDFYVRVAPMMLPHLRGRPVTLHRFPEGVSGPHFFQTRCPPHPPWVRTQRMYTFTSGKDVEAPVIDDLPSLVWAANLSSIELHPYLGRDHKLERPGLVVFDLDPRAPADLLDACKVALDVRAALDGVGLDSYVKTSGGVGLHVYVPLNNDETYEQTKPFARSVASVLARRDPDRVTDRMPTAGRAGKVFIDWSQNDQGKSTVAPYSLRGGTYPTVSMPVTWDEVEAAFARRDLGRLVFSPRDGLDRVDRVGDLFAPVLEQRQTLP